jgi:glycosyltransferase involved in cell wall biosynthesis
VSSVIDQDYNNIEIIISDNCSSDNTQEICAALCQRYPGIAYYRQPVNRGMTANYSFVLDKATGNYFLWMSDDDTLEPGILTRYVDFLSANPDYALVCGEVKYWEGNKVVTVEKDLTVDHPSPHRRVISYYSRVMQGALFYGLMQRTLAQSIPLRDRIGDDWHFVASAAFAGKIKNLNVAGYNKKLGEQATNLTAYAKNIVPSRFTARFPRMAIAIDAISEVLYLSPQYSRTNVVSRILLAIGSCASVLVGRYFNGYAGLAKKARTSTSLLPASP